VPGITGAVDISVGRNHTCVLLTGGTVSCWGQNDDNVAGNRDTTAFPQSPAPVNGVTGAIDVTASYRSTCVRFANGTASCWGGNEYGELGNGAPNEDGEITPVTMNTGSSSPITALSSNGLSWCALLEDTSAVCWGYYYRRQPRGGPARSHLDPGGVRQRRPPPLSPTSRPNPSRPAVSPEGV
jgi:alpha-tubulin suppressor-like RCC1 family protein